MARIKVTGIDQVSSRIKKEINKAVRDEETRLEIGEIITNDIKNTSFGEPSKKTKEWRDRYDKYNRTDPLYNKNEIKITYTGELLQDLKENVRVDTTQGEVKFTIQHTERLHKKYNKKNGKIGKSRSKYTDISDGLINKLGYNYLKFSDNALNKVIEFIKDKIASKLK